MRATKRQIDALAAGKPAPLTEDELQTQIIAFLRLHGYTVRITSRRVKKCHHCGAWPRSGRGDGASRGLADLLVRKPSWRPGVFLALEIKRPGPQVRWSSRDQFEAWQAGEIILVRSLEDAVAAVASVEGANADRPTQTSTGGG